MPVERTTPQLVKKGKGKKRPGYRGPGEYQGGRGYGGSKSSKGGDKGTGGSKGNLGGGGGGQDSNYRRYSPPTKKTYTSKTIDSKPVTGDDYRRSRDNFVNTLNRNNQIAAERAGTRFTPYQGGARMQRSNSGLGSLVKFLAGLAIPGAGFLLSQGGKLKDGLMGLNDSIQNSDFGRSKNLMDYLDMKKFGGYNEREMARRINMDEAKNLQARIDGGEFGGFDNLGMTKGDLNNLESLVAASKMPQSTFEGYTFDDKIGSSNKYMVPFDGARTIVPNPNFTGELGYEQPNIEFGGTVLEDEFIGQPQEGIMGIDVGYPSNDLMAELSQKQLDFLNQPINQKSLKDPSFGLTPKQIFDKLPSYEEKPFFGTNQEPTTPEEYNQYLDSINVPRITAADGGLASMFTRRG